MMLTHQVVPTAIRVLNQCSPELQPAGPWRWHCVVQNGGRQPLTATVEDGFLQLALHPEAHELTGRTLERVLRGNHRLAGGVRFAYAWASRDLHLRADIVLMEEAQMLHRVHSALAGFHQGDQRLKTPDSQDEGMAWRATSAPRVDLGELLRETTWAYTERGPNAFSVDLCPSPAPPASITADEAGVVLSVELVRCDPGAEMALQALTLFLLTANCALRLVRAHRVDQEGQQLFGFQVCLPASPTAVEIEEGLAALSIAHRMCAREAKLLLDDAAARCYLSVRDAPPN